MKDFIKKFKRYSIFLFLFFHNYLYIYSDGRFGKFLNNRPCLILHTKGAKTQIERKNVLVFLKEGNEICLIASKGGNKNNPGWYHNLIKFQECKVQISNRYLYGITLFLHFSRKLYLHFQVVLD